MAAIPTDLDAVRSLKLDDIAAIVRLFRTGLGRLPELRALVDFGRLMQGGARFEDLAHSIAGSEEFRRLHGPEDVCDARLARFLFRAGLGRDPEPAAVRTMLSAPNRGAALIIVAGSEEAAEYNDLAETLFPDGAAPQDDLAYRLWIDLHDTLDAQDRLAIEKHMDRLPPDLPPIGLLMIAPETRPDLVSETLASLDAQFFPRWTLTIACPPGLPASVRHLLAEAAARIPGVTLIAVERGSSLGQTWQAALLHSPGAYIGFLNPGDRLAPTALYEFAVALAQAPHLAMLYCDEDSLDSLGQRCHPCLKTGWSQELLYAGDCVGQLALIARQRILDVGGIRADGGSFSRYDLVLRVTEGLHPGAIRHIPAVLFHQGRQPGQALPFPKLRATHAHPELRQTATRHLAETRPGLLLEDAYLGGNVWPRLIYPAPETPPLVSIVIPTRDQPARLATCIEGLLDKTAYPAFEILIADNGSEAADTLGLLRRLSRDPRIRVERIDAPFNWSAMNNRLAAQARGDVLLFLNDDIEITHPDWLDEMVRHAMRPEVGVVGARLLYPDGSLQHGGIVLNENGATHVLRSARAEEAGYLGQLVLTRRVSAVTGACLMTRRDVFDTLGGFDPRLAVTCNDVEYCLRAGDRGLQVVWTPHACLTHLECATRGYDDTPERVLEACYDTGLLMQAWPAPFAADPYLNGNLDVTDHALILAFPPRRAPSWPQLPRVRKDEAEEPATRGVGGRAAREKRRQDRLRLRDRQVGAVAAIG